jgi:hypothetical protein
MLRSFFGAFVAIGLFAGCASSSDGGTSNENDIAAATEYRLPGVSETVLLADENGRVSVAKLGDPTTVAAPAVESGVPIVAGRSFDGRFWLLDQDGALVIVDPAGGAPTKRALGLEDAGDIEIDSVHSAWVSAGAKIAHVDPSTGQTLATLDLASYALDGGRVRATGIKRVGDRLFVQLGREKDRVQRGAVVVVDPTAARVESVIELEVGTEIGYDPGGAMVVDTVHAKLLLTARGFRPSNTGMVLRIDLAQKKLDPWFFRGGSGFQGGLALGPDPATIYIAYHTSTPVASTHVFHYLIGSDGEMKVQDNASLLDAFEEVDDYPANASGTLFALPVTCPAGFCIGGKGVSFIDTKTAKPLPRFGAAVIGMSPQFVLFL